MFADTGAHSLIVLPSLSSSLIIFCISSVVFMKLGPYSLVDGYQDVGEHAASIFRVDTRLLILHINSICMAVLQTFEVSATLLLFVI